MATPPRLLILASNNRSNQRNINWFLAEVWPIMLARAQAHTDSDKRPFQVDICGSIADYLQGLDIAGINVLGVVQDVRQQYESCDVVLLPVISGSGVGVKTIEAVLYERPLIATYHALRGLPRNVVDAIGYVDDAAMFARQVVSVVTTSDARLIQTERSRRGAQALREENFYLRLGQAMDAVRLDLDTTAGLERDPRRWNHRSGESPSQTTSWSGFREPTRTETALVPESLSKSPLISTAGAPGD